MAGLDFEPVTVLFGPNGAGKSTWLDIVWFIRDCCIRSFSEASADRSHGIGMLWSKAAQGERIGLDVETDVLRYTMEIGFSNGRIDPFPGETLVELSSGLVLFSRRMGSPSFLPAKALEVDLIEPDKPALNQYLAQNRDFHGVREFDHILRHIRFYDSRSAALFELRRHGSEADFRTVLWSPRGQNLWSVLRNLNDKRHVDDRYSTIRNYMKQAFPDFVDIIVEATGPQSVYGSFMLKDAQAPVMASGVSTGHLQMLMHLTSLFSDATGHEPVILLDEPENSLHPHALAVLASAIRESTQEKNRQIVVATHSPVLLSQFSSREIVAVEKNSEGATILRKVSEMPGMDELLEEYAAGSLYMAEALAPQEKPAGDQERA
jgi:predicted ATPase